MGDYVEVFAVRDALRIGRKIENAVAEAKLTGGMGKLTLWIDFNANT